MIRKRLALGIILALSLQGTALAQVLAVANSAANIRSYPTMNSSSNIILQVPRYYPLEVQEEKGQFFKVLDYKSRTGWIHNSVVREIQSAVVTVPLSNVRKGPGTQFDVVFQAKEGVTFHILDEKDKWLKVEHESNRKGWIYKPLVWGF